MPKMLPFAVIATLALAPALAAQPAESLSAWQWYQEIRLPRADDKSPYFDFTVSPAVFDQAQPDLRDLRIVDGKGSFIPYALFVRNPVERQEVVPFEQFNEGASGVITTVTLELKGGAQLEHNGIQIATAGENFRRRVELEGKADKEGDWSTILGGDKAFLAQFLVDGKEIRIDSIPYPVSRLAFLRVRVFADPSSEGKQAPTIRDIKVFRRVRLPGDYVMHEAKVGEREPSRDDLGPASAWVIDLGARVPCSQLLLKVDESGFARPYRLERILGNQVHEVLQRSELRRIPGEEKSPLQINFPEIFTRKLRLVVADAANPPLTLRAISYVAARREVILPASGPLTLPGGKGVGEGGVRGLRLYYGNPAALAPSYDFAANLDPRPLPAPATASLSTATANPDYRPPEILWSERWPGLIYVVLSFSSLALMGILVLLGREGLRQSAVAKPTQAERS